MCVSVCAGGAYVCVTKIFRDFSVLHCTVSY